MVEYLYHATYNAYLDDILEQGLLANSPNCNWEGLSRKVVCLCADEEDAISFCESADSVDDDIYYSGIVVIESDANDLDQDLLFADSNVSDEDAGCFEYLGDISANYLRVLDL